MHTYNKRQTFLNGMKDGFPVAIGYFAVSFSLGISARLHGLDAIQAFLISVLCVSSSGEYAAFSLIADHAPFLEMAVMIIIINARYILMSCAMSQKMSEKLPLRHRLLVGFGVTDELFALTIRRPGQLHPYYPYGICCICIPFWGAGTAFGAILGNVLPEQLVSAFAVALYGMFLAIIVPPAKQNKVVLVLVILGFVTSYIASRAAMFAGISSGTKIIILTIILAGAAAILFPVKQEEGEDKENA